MLIKQILINLLLHTIVLSYVNFNQLRVDMEYKVSILAKTIQNSYAYRSNQTQISCPIQSFNYCQGTDTRQCLDNFPKSPTCNGTPSMSVTTGVRIPSSLSTLNLSNQLKYFICKTSQPEIQNQFKKLVLSNNNNHASAYFGSNTGAHRKSPVTKSPRQGLTQACPDYDPRLRPWYGPNVYQRKKMIILVQNSKRIHQLPNRYMSIQLSLQALLRTADPGDYFNIVEYSNTSRALFSEYDMQLVSLGSQVQLYNNETATQDMFYQAVANNITKSEIIESNLTQALQLALTILYNSKHQNADYQNLILIFQGFASTNLTISMSTQISQLIQNKMRQNKLNITIFTFAVNMHEKSGKNLLKNLACSFDGIYFQINNLNYQSNFIDQAAGYYDFLIQGNQVTYQKWTKFYNDSSGLGSMTTVVRPVYYMQGDVLKLIGIAGVDILLSQLVMYKDLSLIQPLLQSTEQIFKKNITYCVLESIRRNHRCSKVCSFTGFDSPKITPANLSIFKSPVDISPKNYCFHIQSSRAGLIAGLVFGIFFFILTIILLLYCLVCRKRHNSDLQNSYSQIFKQFTNFDQSRIRSDSQISLIKQ